jgi:hypothetical protein
VIGGAGGLVGWKGSDRFLRIAKDLLEAMNYGIPAVAVAINESRVKLAGDVLALDPKETESAWAIATHALIRNPEQCSETG